MDEIVYGARIKDEKALMSSSSGGAFTVITDYFLEQKFGVLCSIYNYEKHSPEFTLITDFSGRNLARGSVYVQSDMKDIFKKAYEWLKTEENGELLFFGMGCQAAGFRKYAEMKGFLERVTVVDIICHGVSSPGLWKDYISALEEKYGKISKVSFKDKRYGWKYPTAVAIADNKEIKIDDYMKNYSSRRIMRPSCYRCPYTTYERESDITIGDLWYVDERRPEFYDRRGNSVMILHTLKGKEIFNNVKEKIEYLEIDEEVCRQPNLEKPTKPAEDRELFWDEYRRMGAPIVIAKMGKISLIDKIKKRVKIVLVK